VSGAAVPAGVLLRLMGDADLDAYKQLRDSMLAAHEDAFTSDAATERQREAQSYRSRVAAPAGRGGCVFTLCAWQGPRMVGAVSCEQESRLKQRHVAQVVGMMVADDCQGQGLGRALLQSALKLLRSDEAIETAVLSVTSSNAGAVRLYESLGFAPYGRLPRAIRLASGEYLDKTLMYLDLRPAASPTMPPP
jgi:ribosomal protein S18 acetylase RimI-like enzyme